MSDGEQLELIHLLLHVPDPLGQRQVAGVIPDFWHFIRTDLLSTAKWHQTGV